MDQRILGRGVMKMVEKVRVRDWRAARADALRSGSLSEGQIAEARSELLAESRSFKLAELRKSVAMTQEEVAQAMDVAQPRVSQIENGDIERSELGTIRSYAEALGGRLYVVVEVGDQTVRIE